MSNTLHLPLKAQWYEMNAMSSVEAGSEIAESTDEEYYDTENDG